MSACEICGGVLEDERCGRPCLPAESHPPAVGHSAPATTPRDRTIDRRAREAARHRRTRGTYRDAMEAMRILAGGVA